MTSSCQTEKLAEGRMIEGRTILCFASGYDAPPTSKHHLMHLLAEKNTVIWVNYHASRVPKATSSDLRHLFHKLKQVFVGLQCPRKHLYVITPLVIPLPNSNWARRLNRTLLIGQIRRVLYRLQAGPVIVWSFTPDIAYVLGHFHEEKVLYYCVDDHASFTGYDRNQVLHDEAELCRKADLVVTTSKALQSTKCASNPNTILIPHGVDFEHFATATTQALPVPPEIAPIPHPRLGFFGLIRDWVDLELLAEVAHRQKDWHFVLIGDSTVDLARYRSIANMHFLGRKPYEQLPAYCRQFDIGLIPFQINDLTRAVNPIKLREYLSAGLPVVSTPLPEVKAFSQTIKIASTPETFISAVSSSLAEDPSCRRQRSASMASETWSEKLATVCDRLVHIPNEAGKCRKQG